VNGTASFEEGQKKELHRSPEITHGIAQEAWKDFVTYGMNISFCINTKSA
jgi:hypothetical protein